MGMKYVVVSNVKKLARAKGRRIGSDFLAVLDSFIARKVELACMTKNGGKMTVDADVAVYVGLK